MTAGTAGTELTEAISAALVLLYGEFYDHDRTTATTYINDNVVVCIPRTSSASASPPKSPTAPAAM